MKPKQPPKGHKQDASTQKQNVVQRGQCRRPTKKVGAKEVAGKKAKVTKPANATNSANVTYATNKPRKLNDVMILKFCDRLRRGSGVGVETICESLCINKVTFYRWLKQGEEEAGTDSLHDRFRVGIEKARADLEIELATEARTTSAAYVLSRKFTERWPSEKHALELTGKDGAPVQITTNPVQVNLIVQRIGGSSPVFPYRDCSSQAPGSPSGIGTPQLEANISQGQIHLDAKKLADLERYKREAQEAEARISVNGRLSHVLR